MNFLKYYKQCSEVREKFLLEENQNTRERLIKEFVLYLQGQGLNVEEIDLILNVEELNEAQCNAQMITNNKSYKQAVAKALGKK